MLNNEEFRRYSRHLIMSEVGLEGQRKLKKTKVLVIGAGGLGCPVLQYLTAVGIGTIGILDFDTVSLSNLQRQILYTTNDIGKPKAEVAYKKLSALNPNTNFIVHNEALRKSNVFGILKNYDLIIDGTDNFPSRYLLNDACVILGKPFVFGAIFKFHGQVSVFNYKNGPTYRCLFPDQPKEKDVPNCSTIGVIGVIPGIIGTIRANEAIKIILEKGNILSGKLLQVDLLTMKFDTFDFKKSEEDSNITKLSEYGETCALDIDEPNIASILSEELHKKIQNKEDIFLVDVRTKKQFEDYNIGGRYIDEAEILNNPDILPKDKMIVFVCEFGEKSAAFVEYFDEQVDYPQTFNLIGGIQEWVEKGFELIKM